MITLGTTINDTGNYMLSHLILKKTQSLSRSVSLKTNHQGVKFLIVEHEKLKAAFSLHGGHLLHFQKAHHKPLIWLSKNAIFNGEKAIRGGIPICWPWFGTAHPSLGENLPAHGFARNSKWVIGNIEESDEGVELELKLHSNENTLALWPHQFELTLKATLNNQLKLQLITENKSNKPFTYRGALHTYLNISAPQSVVISGLSKQFTNSLKNKRRETGDTTLVIDKAIDAVYKKSNGDILIKDKLFQHTLTMTNKGNDSEVLWTPWIEGAATFPDMPDNGYQTMFCIESAITETHGQLINQGEKHILSTLIK